MEHKVVIVTGASRGIGRAIAILLAAHNFAVVGVYKNSTDEAEALDKSFEKITMMQADLAKPSEIDSLVTAIIEKFGRIDALVNNAGVFKYSKTEDFSLADFDELINVNLRAPFYLAQKTLPYLTSAPDGVIVNLSTQGGFLGHTFYGCTSYSASYAGVNALTEGLAKELDGSVRVNLVIPTLTNTDRIKNSFPEEELSAAKESGKLGTPEEAATLVLKVINGNANQGQIITDERVSIDS